VGAREEKDISATSYRERRERKEGKIPSGGVEKKSCLLRQDDSNDQRPRPGKKEKTSDGGKEGGKKENYLRGQNPYRHEKQAGPFEGGKQPQKEVPLHAR